MADTTYPPRRPLTVSEVLDLTFHIYRATLFKCVLLGALGLIVQQLPAIYSLARGERPATLADVLSAPGITHLQAHNAHPGVTSVLTLLGTVLSLVFTGAIFFRQQALLTGAPLGGEVSASLKRVPGSIGLLLLICLCIGACLLPAALVAVGVATGVIGVLIALVAATYVMVALSCAFTVFYIDRAGAMDSLQRSWRLASGNFWRLSVVYTVVAIVLFAAYALIFGVAGVIGGIIGGADLTVVGALVSVVGVALGAFVTPFYTAMGLAVLGDLSARKEGSDLERRIAAG
jgi:hypothetical protein